MLKERLQVLVTGEQRRRLLDEARRRETSVGSLVREAIDDRYGGTSREQRLRAVEAIRQMKGTPVSPAELNRLVEEERTAGLDPRRA